MHPNDINNELQIYKNAKGYLIMNEQCIITWKTKNLGDIFQTFILCLTFLKVIVFKWVIFCVSICMMRRLLPKCT